MVLCKSSSYRNQHPISQTPGDNYTQFLRLPGLFNILNRLLQILHLLDNFLLCFLSTLHRLDLKLFNPRQNSTDVIRNRLKRLCGLLNFVNDGRVLEDGTVIGQVDGGARRLELVEFVVGVDVAFAEGGEGGGCVGSEGQRRGEFGPVDLGNCGAGGHWMGTSKDNGLGRWMDGPPSRPQMAMADEEKQFRAAGNLNCNCNGGCIT